MESKNKYSKIILTASILTIIIFLSFTVSLFIHSFPEFYTLTDKLKEYTLLLFHLPFLTPAIIGLFSNKKIENNIIVCIGYVVYLFVYILCYSTIFLYTDSLSGLLLIVLLAPLTAILSIYLFYLLIIKKL